jgi:hypothetical protein
VNITKIETIIEDIKQSQKEKISMDDTQGMLDILKAKDQYVLEMENSLYSSWAFGRVKITGRVLFRGGILKKGKFCRKDIFNLKRNLMFDLGIPGVSSIVHQYGNPNPGDVHGV